MSSFQIKIIAAIFMVIDHIGVILFPQYLILRIIGRIAFPIFAWMISVSYSKTSNSTKMLLRLILIGTIIQIPYYIVLRDMYLNIFFTLALGVVCIKIYERTIKKRYIAFPLVLIVGLIAEYMNSDYGLYGVMTIFIFYLFADNIRKIIYSQVILNIVNVSYIAMINYFNNRKIINNELVQVFSLASLIIIYNYNGKRGRKWKYFFYLFYPLHIVLIYSIKVLIAK